MRRLRLLVVFLAMLAAVVWLATGMPASSSSGNSNCQENCPTRNAPLCARQGSSGARKNFANQCELDRYNCRFKQALRKIKDGSC